MQGCPKIPFHRGANFIVGVWLPIPQRPRFPRLPAPVAVPEGRAASGKRRCNTMQRIATHFGDFGPCCSAGRPRRLRAPPVQHNATNCNKFRGFRPPLQCREAPPPPGTAAGVTQCNELQHISEISTPVTEPDGHSGSRPAGATQCNELQHISGILAPTAAPNGYDRLASGRDRAWDRGNPGDPAVPLPKDLPI